MSDAERRDSDRVKIPGDLECEVLVYQPMTLTEISLGGALVETAFPLPLDSSHDLRLPIGSTSVIVSARVVHSHISRIGGGHVTYQSGIEFVAPSGAVVDAITALLVQLGASRCG